MTEAQLPAREIYPAFVNKLFKEMGSDAATAMHAAVGISGEAGEVIDAVKKYWVYNKPLDLENLKEELGDILFYMQKLCNMYDWSLEDVMVGNIQKLLKRYPDGYSDAAAQLRADKAVVNKLDSDSIGLEEVYLK